MRLSVFSPGGIVALAFGAAIGVDLATREAEFGNYVVNRRGDTRTVSVRTPLVLGKHFVDTGSDGTLDDVYFTSTCKMGAVRIHRKPTENDQKEYRDNVLPNL